MGGERPPLALVDRDLRGLLEPIPEAHVFLRPKVEHRDFRVLEFPQFLLLGAELGLCLAAFRLADPRLLAFALLALARFLARLALRLLFFLERLAFGLAFRGKRLRPFLRRTLLLGHRLFLGDPGGLRRGTFGLAFLLPLVPADLAADDNDEKNDDKRHVGHYRTNTRGAFGRLGLAPRFFKVKPASDRH